MFYFQKQSEKSDRYLRGVTPCSLMSTYKNSPLFAPLKELKAKLQLNNISIRNKMNEQEDVLSELMKMLVWIIQRQSNSFNRMSSIVKKLCQRLLKVKGKTQLVDSAHKLMKNQGQEWRSVQERIKERVSTIRLEPDSLPAQNINQNDGFKLKTEEDQELYDFDQDEDKTFPSTPNPPVIELLSNRPSHLKKKSKDPQSIAYRQRISNEYADIKKYVGMLGPFLQYSPDGVIHKKIVLNNYINWKAENKMDRYINDMANIQAELTVRIKELMPKVLSIRKLFKYIQFRKEFRVNMDLTDRSPPYRSFDYLRSNSLNPQAALKKIQNGIQMYKEQNSQQNQE